MEIENFGLLLSQNYKLMLAFAFWDTALVGTLTYNSFQILS